MADIKLLIQQILEFQEMGTTTQVVLTDGRVVSGEITSFSGRTVTINDEEIPFSEVESVSERPCFDPKQLQMTRATIVAKDGEIEKLFDAVILDCDDEHLSFITSAGQETILFSDVLTIKDTQGVIIYTSEESGATHLADDESPQEVIADDIQIDVKVLSNDDILDNSAVVIDAESDFEKEKIVDDIANENLEKSKENPLENEANSISVDNDEPVIMEKESEEQSHELNSFERAIIYGDTITIKNYITGRNSLVLEGYTDDEINHIKSVKLEVQWGQEPIIVANRVYAYQKNKNNLAKECYETAASSYKKGSKEYIDAINSLFPLITDSGEYVSFWKRNNKYVQNKKAAAALANVYIQKSLELNGVVPNAFEQKVIEADKGAVKKMIDDGTLLRLDYTEDEVRRAHNALQVINWDTSWYKTAARIYSLQVNKHRLAEVYYEAALVIVDKKTSEYTKILNTLATIKIAAGSKEFISFFGAYRAKLIANSNYCSAYANALIAVQDWKKLRKEMPMLREKLSDNPGLIDRYEEELKYYETMPEFNIADITPVFERYNKLLMLESQMESSANTDSEEDISSSVLEKNLIVGLPSRAALKSLLEMYRLMDEEEAFFALAEYSMPYIKEDKASMKELLFMLKSCTDGEYLYKLLPGLPVFWGDVDLVRRYADISERMLPTDISENRVRLNNHIASMGSIKPLNPFEICIINGDYDGVRSFIESPELLEGLGYTVDQIEEMRTVDLDENTSPNMYVMRRVLAFQGNTNHTAEHYLFDAFYDSKVDMCNRLFPLLLAEKRGSLIVELFNFDRNLNRNIKSLKRYYLVAVSITEEDDDKFYSIAEPEWINYPEDEIIDRLLKIAVDRNDELLRKNLELQKSKPQGNDFEIAVIEANTDAIRNYVKNADLLVELGYTPEEIKRISRIFESNSVNPGSKPGQVASRVYLFQKNKNNLAEQLFLRAMSEDAPEDVENDCKALYQIYQAQHNYEMICKIYEDYLCEASSGKFNSNNASAYCVALFELGKYQEFLAFVKDNRDVWDNFMLFHFLLFVDEVLDDHELDSWVMSGIKGNSYRPDIIAGYLLHVISNNTDTLHSKMFVDILNLFFCYLQNDDISEIRKAFSEIGSEGFLLPDAALIYALASEEDSGKYISMWLDNTCKDIDKISLAAILLKLAEVFTEANPVVIERLTNLYCSLDSDEVSEAKKREIEEFLNTSITIAEQKNIWSEIRKDIILSGRGNIDSLRYFIEESAKTESYENIKSVFLLYRSQFAASEDYQSAYRTLYYIYQLYSQDITDNDRKWLVDELISYSSKFNIDYVGMRELSELCKEVGKEFESHIYRDAAISMIPSSADSSTVASEKSSHDVEEGFYVSSILKTLNDKDYYKSFSVLRNLSKYIDLSDEEKLLIEQLRNTIRLANQWTLHEINTLAKAIYSEPTNGVYWKMLQAWVSDKAEKNPVLHANILFSLTSRGEKEMEDAIDFAVASDFKEMALGLSIEMLKMGEPTYNIHAQKKLRDMVEKGWFEDNSFKEDIPELLGRISDNITLQNAEDYVWNSVSIAADLSIASNQYRDFIYLFKGYLSRECVKQATAMLAAMMLDGNTESADEVLECINTSYADNPYRELVTDLYASSKNRALSESELMVLKCVTSDHGNALGVDALLGFYCEMHNEGKCECGLDVVNLLMKYQSYDPVLPEVAACFCREISGEDSIFNLYNYLYEYSNMTPTDKPVQYLVGQMICGENYFRMKGKEVKSFRKLIDDRFPSFGELARSYQEFCDCVNMGLRSTGCEDFAEILFAAVFTGDWTPVFEYKPEDLTVETVLEQNIATERINIAYEYYRSIVKSIAVFLLNNDILEMAHASKRMRFLWSKISNVGCSIDYFTEALQWVEYDCVPELIKIWTLDIETLTVFKKHFGAYILSQEHCDRYAHVFNVFLNAKGSDIFGNQETKKLLKRIDHVKAQVIAEAYESLYIRNSGPAVSEVTGIKYVQESNYEKNVFSNYLKRTDPNYWDHTKRAERFRKKYEMVCSINNVHDVSDANGPNRLLNTKLQIFSLRALFFYYALLSDKEDYDVFNGIREGDLLNAMAIAISDDMYFTGLNGLIKKIDDNERVALGILILSSDPKNLNKAADIALELKNNKLKPYICSRLIALYGKKRPEQYYKLHKAAKNSNLFWVRTYRRATGLRNLDPWVYINGDKQIEATNKDERNQITDDATIQDAVAKIIENENIISNSGMMANSDEATTDIPLFISELLDKSIEDKELQELLDQWKTRKEQVEDAVDDTNALASLDQMSIEIGVALILRERGNIDEALMGQVFKLVKPNSIDNMYLISGLQDILQSYICSFSNLDLLAESVYDLRDEINHLCYEQNYGNNYRVQKDMRAASFLIEVLTNISVDLNSAMGEESLKERLISYQKEIFGRIKDISKLRNATNSLNRKLTDKIYSLNYVPKLNISHDSLMQVEGKDKISWLEKWYNGADKGFIRGVVSNTGGAPAMNVALSISVNSEMREVFHVERIAPGKSIPFAVPYYRNDVIDDNVSWTASATYSSGGGNNMTSHCMGSINVIFVDAEWDGSFIGRDRFDAQFPAESEDFYGRTNELMRLNSLYNVNIPVNRYPSLLITGLRRAGKSSVIKKFKSELKNRDDLAPILVDAQSCAGDPAKAFFGSVFIELRRDYRNEIEGLSEFKSKWENQIKEEDWVGLLPEYFISLSELLGGRKIIFIMDEMENVFYSNLFEGPQKEEQFFGMIRSLIQNYQEFVSFIFCGSDKLLTSCLEQKRESQMFQVLQRIYVGRMSINDIRDMFTQYNNVYAIRFRDDAINRIMYYTNGLIWYTKLIAFNVLDKIVDPEHIYREEIHPMDVDSIIEMLINGDLGAELTDLLDNNFGSKRKAIIRAMAKASSSREESVNAETISVELAKLNYVDTNTGEVLGSIPMDEIIRNLGVLEKMDFIEKDPQKEQSYRFTTELYRLLMLSQRRINKFVAEK